MVARFFKLPLFSWISSNSRTFSMAITAWSAKVVASWGFGLHDHAHQLRQHRQFK